uniref:Uncharacterized protein n=1 Tax=Cacopsylla melanoneura TaxID=428564 RepID=A0A8D8XZ45_9HEMI
MTPSIQILMRKQTWNVAFTSTNQNLLRNICLKTNYWMGFQTGWTDCLRALHHASTLRHGRSSKWHNVLSSQHHGLFALSLSLLFSTLNYCLSSCTLSYFFLKPFNLFLFHYT